eukprot:2021292-Amphidinium_carterae.2
MQYAHMRQQGARLPETSQSLIEDLLDVLARRWGFKLHGHDLGDESLHVVVDGVPANLIHTRGLMPHCHHGQVA